MKNKTKELIAQAFKSLLEKKRFQDITVTEICQAVDCQRKTFYYHFDDKYHLAAWIYLSGINQVWDPQNGPYDFTSNYIKGLEFIYNDFPFYRKVLPDDALSGLYKHIVRHGDILFEELISNRIGSNVIDDELKFLIHFSNLAQICVIREWVFSNNPEKPEELVRKLLAAFPNRLKKYLL